MLQKWPDTMPIIWLALGGSLLAAGASLAPLLCYSLSMAIFGMPHVLAELRYVDARFGRRLDRKIIRTFALLLGLLVLTRVLSVGGMLPASTTPFLELSILVLLILSVLPLLLQAGAIQIFCGLAVLLLTIFGLSLNPAASLVVLALLHNMTPLGFLLERLPRTRRPALGVGAIMLLLVFPLTICTGVLSRGLDTFMPDLTELSALRTGPLIEHIGAFIPEFWRRESHERHLFAAAVYLQLLHYAAVLHVLPKLVRDEDARTATLSWPNRRPFQVFLIAVGTLSLIGFLFSFHDARLVYGVFAAVHAFIEIPVLLFALTPCKTGSPSLELEREYS